MKAGEWKKQMERCVVGGKARWGLVDGGDKGRGGRVCVWEEEEEEEEEKVEKETLVVAKDG
ncbi:hypothetical protein E2C01_047518 [Portunus trituberculatus]|uniref:Uncharacterized protein n=1 Tax=Portunus trituberculatus TaxID=210409 RepID=A0A5B7G7T2_PORTR|nr:hypothetical protein [Portunus trituberculatus]